MSVMQERTGWRDLEFSKRYRFYGDSCCAVDLDYMPCRFVEYYQSRPVAIIEYKHEKAIQQDYSRPNFQVLIWLGNKAELPVFCVRYSADFSQFIIDPLNDYALKFCTGRVHVSEFEFVRFLHTLRGLKVHDDYIKFLLKKADDEKCQTQ